MMRRLFVSIKGLYIFLDLTSPLNTHALYDCSQVSGFLWWVITRGFSLKKAKTLSDLFLIFTYSENHRKLYQLISKTILSAQPFCPFCCMLMETLFNDIQLMFLKNILETAFFWLKYGHFIPWLLLSKMIYYSLHLVLALELVLDI